jgi:hypothetical protein
VAQRSRNYLQAVGIRAKLNQLQVAALARRQASCACISAVGAAIPSMTCRPSSRISSTAEPMTMREIRRAVSSNDATTRKYGYSAAIQRVTERAYWAPLHTYVMPRFILAIAWVSAALAQGREARPHAHVSIALPSALTGPAW